LLHDQGFDLAVIIVEIIGSSIEFRNVELIEAGPIWPSFGHAAPISARMTLISMPEAQIDPANVKEAPALLCANVSFRSPESRFTLQAQFDVRHVLLRGCCLSACEPYGLSWA